MRIIAAVFVASGVSYGLYASYAGKDNTIRVLEAPQNNTQNQNVAEKQKHFCDNLEEITLENMKKIIKIGYLPASKEPLFQNFSSNVSAMSLHKCDKDALHTHINKHLTMDDPLYFELNGLL